MGAKGKPIEVEGARRCSRCGLLKSIEAGYYRDAPGRYPHSWCATCRRLQVHEYRQTEEFRAKWREYMQRPEVLAARAESSRRRAAKQAASARLRAQTPRGKLMHCRVAARGRLRRATSPERIAALESLIACYDRELARMAP